MVAHCEVYGTANYNKSESSSSSEALLLIQCFFFSAKDVSAKANLSNNNYLLCTFVSDLLPFKPSASAHRLQLQLLASAFIYSFGIQLQPSDLARPRGDPKLDWLYIKSYIFAWFMGG
jgi:hypothetical protein